MAQTEARAQQTARDDDPRAGAIAGALAAVTGGALVLLYWGVGYRHRAIASAAMAPTLLGPDAVTGRTGDRVGVDHWASPFRGPRRGEIWIFRAPPQASPSEKEFVMRVMGVPGDTVEVVPPRLLVDGRTGFRVTEFFMGAVQMAPDHQSASLGGGWKEVPFQAIASGLKVSSSPYVVRLGDRVVLEDQYGRIRRVEDPATYGAEVGVVGVGFQINGDLRLVIFCGETLEYVPGFVCRNGERLVEPYIEGPPRYAMSERRLGRGEYFVLGDYRNNANDSHVWGPLTRDRFVGRVTHRYWPRERAGAL